MTSITALLLGTLVALIGGSILFLFVKALIVQHAPDGQFQFGQSRSSSPR